MTRYMHCRDCGLELEDPLHTLAGFCWDCREDAAIEGAKRKAYAKVIAALEAIQQATAEEFARRNA